MHIRLETSHLTDHVERGSSKCRKTGTTCELISDNSHGSVNVEVTTNLSRSCKAVSKCEQLTHIEMAINCIVITTLKVVHASCQ